MYFFLDECWQLVYFKKFVNFICYQIVVGRELFIAFSYYSSNDHEISINDLSFISCISTLCSLSLFLLNVGRELSILLMFQRTFCFVYFLYYFYVLSCINFYFNFYISFSSACFRLTYFLFLQLSKVDFQIIHFRSIIQYLQFFAWPLSRSTTFSRFTHVVDELHDRCTIRTSFLHVCMIFHCVNVPESTLTPGRQDTGQISFSMIALFSVCKGHSS